MVTINIFVNLEKNIYLLYTMSSYRNKRNTQKKVKGGWLWCEIFPLKFIKPCTNEELIAERNRESMQLEKDRIKKEKEDQIKIKESELDSIKKQKEEEIKTLKANVNVDTTTTNKFKLWGGKNKKSQKTKTQKKKANKSKK